MEEEKKEQQRGMQESIHIVVELLKQNFLCRWFRFAQLAKGKKFRP
jgi:hypothetical protein